VECKELRPLNKTGNSASRRAERGSARGPQRLNEDLFDGDLDLNDLIKDDVRSNNSLISENERYKKYNTVEDQNRNMDNQNQEYGVKKLS